MMARRTMGEKDEKKYPNMFNVFITENCNLDCSYCFVNKISHTHSFSFSDFKRSVDRFLSYPGNKKSISFLGGEPLMQFSALRKFHRYALQKAKEKNIKLSVYMVTNGTLLTRDKHAFIGRMIKEGNATVKVSIDGIKSAHDSNRIFKKSGKKSSFDAIFRNLENFKGDKARMPATLVLTPKTVDTFLDGVKFLYASGFRKIDFYPDIYAYWSAGDLKKLKKVLGKFKDYYVSLHKEGSDPLKNSSIDFVLFKSKIAGGENRKPSCRKMHVSPNGDIYFCDKVFSLPLSERKKYIIGNVKRPIDNEKRVRLVKKFTEKAGAILGKKCESCAYREFCACPIGHYIYFTHKKLPVNKYFNNFCRLSKIMWGAFFDVRDECKRSEKTLSNERR